MYIFNDHQQGAANLLLLQLPTVDSLALTYYLYVVHVHRHGTALIFTAAAAADRLLLGYPLPYTRNAAVRTCDRHLSWQAYPQTTTTNTQ